MLSRNDQIKEFSLLYFTSPLSCDIMAFPGMIAVVSPSWQWIAVILQVDKVFQFSPCCQGIAVFSQVGKRVQLFLQGITVISPGWQAVTVISASWQGFVVISLSWRGGE